MRKSQLVLCLSVCLGVMALDGQGQIEKQQPRVGIVYTAPHPVINSIIDGFKEVVRADFPEAEFVERHASGNESEYSSAVLNVIGKELDLLAPITTPIAKIAVNEARGRTPVVFMGVTDPVGAEVARTLEAPEMATGSSDVCPFAALLDLTRRSLPAAKILGLAYNPSDQPAVYGQEQFARLAPRFGFTLESRQVSSLDELPFAVTSLAQSVDAVLIGPDNLMMENPAAVANATREVGTPLFACDAESVDKGAVAGVSVDYKDVGRSAGRLAVLVLRGADPGKLPVAVLESGGFLINKRAACELELDFPPDVLAKAQILHEDFICQSGGLDIDSAAFWAFALICVLMLAGLVVLGLLRRRPR